MTSLERSARYAWMVVALLLPVALLNYLDRQMLATMKASMVSDIPTIANKADGRCYRTRVPFFQIPATSRSAAMCVSGSLLSRIRFAGDPSTILPMPSS